MDINAVYDALVAAINGAQLTGNTLQVTAGKGLTYPDPPYFLPFTFQVNYDRSFAGQADATVTAYLLLSRAEDVNAMQEALTLSSSGADTIRDALEAARGVPGQMALSGVANDLQLKTAQGPRLLDFGTDGHFWGVEFTIFVLG